MSLLFFFFPRYFSGNIPKILFWKWQLFRFQHFHRHLGCIHLFLLIWRFNSFAFTFEQAKEIPWHTTSAVMHNLLQLLSELTLQLKPPLTPSFSLYTWMKLPTQVITHTPTDISTPFSTFTSSDTWIVLSWASARSSKSLMSLLQSPLTALVPLTGAKGEVRWHYRRTKSAWKGGQCEWLSHHSYLQDTYRMCLKLHKVRCDRFGCSEIVILLKKPKLLTFLIIHTCAGGKGLNLGSVFKSFQILKFSPSPEWPTEVYWLFSSAAPSLSPLVIYFSWFLNHAHGLAICAHSLSELGPPMDSRYISLNSGLPFFLTDTKKGLCQ